MCEIDARRLLCPMPLIKLQEKLAELRAGEQLKLICRDPGVEYDIPAWCRIHGHTVLSITHDERDINIIVEK